MEGASDARPWPQHLALATEFTTGTETPVRHVSVKPPCSARRYGIAAVMEAIPKSRWMTTKKLRRNPVDEPETLYAPPVDIGCRRRALDTGPAMLGGRPRSRRPTLRRAGPVDARTVAHRSRCQAARGRRLNSGEAQRRGQIGQLARAHSHDLGISSKAPESYFNPGRSGLAQLVAGREPSNRGGTSAPTYLGRSPSSRMSSNRADAAAC